MTSVFLVQAAGVELEVTAQLYTRPDPYLALESASLPGSPIDLLPVLSGPAIGAIENFLADNVDQELAEMRAEAREYERESQEDR